MSFWQRAAGLALGAGIYLLAGPDLAAAPPEAAATDTAAPSQPKRFLPVQVILNQSDVGLWTLLESDGQLLIPVDAISVWRLNPRFADAPVRFRGLQWQALRHWPGLQTRFEEESQTLQVELASGAFEEMEITAPTEQDPTVSEVEPSLFINYDATLTQQQATGAPQVRDAGLLTEIGYASPAGVLTSSHLTRQIQGMSTAGSHFTHRLETTFTRDFPQQGMSLRLGDSVTPAGIWGRATYFGGVQLASNFALSPTFVSQPLPALRGTSNAPSTVELYINDALRQVSNVPSGPFTINSMAGVTGAGKARMVIRDALGRETLVEQPFYTHAQLLGPDHSEWSTELGKTRKYFGTAQALYDQSFVSGLYRRGITPQWTVEGKGAAHDQLQQVSLTNLVAVKGQIALLAGLGLSTTPLAGRGQSALLGLERQTPRNSWMLRHERHSSEYRILGQDQPGDLRRSETSATFSMSLGATNSWGGSRARLLSREGQVLNTHSLFYATRVGTRGSLNVLLTHVVQEQVKNRSLTLIWNLPLDSGQTLAAHLTKTASGSDAYVSASQTPGEDPWGWRVARGQRVRQEFTEAGLNHLGHHGDYSLTLYSTAHENSWRLGGRGALVGIGGRVYATQPIRGAYALVEALQLPDVGVGIGGAVQARTDGRGRALLTNLVPYQSNAIRLKATDIPISAEIDSVEQRVVPGWRSAVRARFNAREGRAALVSWTFEDGEPAPAGAQIHRQGDAETYYVARRGEAFVTGIAGETELTLSWRGQSCSVKVQLPPARDNNFARLGPLLCQGVQR